MLHTAFRKRVSRDDFLTDLRFRFGFFHEPLHGMETEHLRLGILWLQRLDPLVQS